MNRPVRQDGIFAALNHLDYFIEKNSTKGCENLVLFALHSGTKLVNISGYADFVGFELDTTVRRA